MALTEQAARNLPGNEARNSSQQVASVSGQCASGGRSIMNPCEIDFEECLKDSPNFRQSLKENLASIEQLENSMSRTIKQITNYIDTGREHIKAQKDLVSSMRSLNHCLGQPHQVTSDKVNTLLETLSEISQLQEIVIDQSARTVGSCFMSFINSDFSKLREARKGFEKISHEYDQAVLRHSQPLKRQQEDSENLLIATSTAFTHTSLDLSIQLTELQSKKAYEILHSLLSLTRAHATYFHQGYDLFDDFKPSLSEIDEHLLKVQDEFETLARNLPSKHLMVSNNELKPLNFDNRAQQIHLEGYLFKRASNGFKAWNRRWFILKDHQLVYMKRGDPQSIVMEEDLRLLTVRPVDKADTERRYCFEIVSPNKSHILQADSDTACKTWIQAIQAGINAAFHDKDSEKPVTRQAFSNDHASLSCVPNANQSQHLDSPSQASKQHNGTSSWSSSFSLKALQQQATSRLNSLTGTDSTRESTSSKKSSRPVSSRSRFGAESCSGSEENDEDVDGEEDVNEDNNRAALESGPCYALLKHDDEDDQINDDDEQHQQQQQQQHNEHVAQYPKPSCDDSGPASTTAAVSSASAEPAPEKPQRAYMIILAMPENDLCADCGASQPRWASINLGITLCIECAGIHRSLGVHLSKVRSLTLDTEVWSPEIVKLMLSLGNSSVNSAYLACYRGQIPAIKADSSREERENWIRAKYLHKSFMRPPGLSLDDSTASEQNISSDPSESISDSNSKQESAASSM